MTTETTETKTETTDQQSEEQRQIEAKEADTALEAGFNETRSATPVEAPAAETTTAKPADAKESSEGKGDKAKTDTVSPPADPVPPLSPELKAQLDRIPGLEARLNEEIRKVYGKVGEFHRDLMNKIAQPGGGKLAKGSLKRMAQEYPEIAEMLEQDLAEALGSAVAAAVTDQKPEGKEAKTDQPSVELDTRINAAVDTAVAKVEKKLLTFMHPQWLQDVKTQEFGEFMATLSAADRKTYLESDDATVAGEAFTKFYDWKKAKAKSQSQSQSQSQTSSARKQERLEAAITPTGDASPSTTSVDDEAALEAGFRSVRGGGG